jgi:hypothetical protein
MFNKLLDYKLPVYILLVISIILPGMFPFTLPVAVPSETRDVYSYIDSLPEGSTVIVSNMMYAAVWPEIGACTVSIFNHMFSKNLKVVMVGWESETPVLFERALDYAEKAGVLDGKVYGEDWVNIGYIPGDEVSISTFADDTWLKPADYFGTSFEELPLMQGIHAVGDADLFVMFDTGISRIDATIRQIMPKSQAFIIGGVMGAYYGYSMPYYQAGQAIGVLGSIKGAAAYETMSGIPGPASLTMNTISLTHVFVFVLIIASNVVYFRGKQGRG